MVERETFKNDLERAGLIRIFALAGMLLFVALIGYFIAYGPLDRQAAYSPAARNIILENVVVAPPRSAMP